MTKPTPNRRQFLAQSAATVAGLLPPGGAGVSPAAGGTPAPRSTRRGLTDTSASPHVVVHGLSLGDVRWTRGFWADRFSTCRRETVPHLWAIMKGTEPSQFFHKCLSGNHFGIAPE
jgi:hypothetical protein